MAYLPQTSSRYPRHGLTMDEKINGCQGNFMTSPSLQGGAFKPVCNQCGKHTVKLTPSGGSEKKCNVYVHHFRRIPKSHSCSPPLLHPSDIHKNRNKPQQDPCEYYKQQMMSLRKQFDSLSIHAKKPKIKGNANATSEKGSKGSFLESKYEPKPAPVPKLPRSLNPKAAMQKLEESYWANWKPVKAPKSDEPVRKKKAALKQKGLYTENKKMKAPYETANNERKERGDSNEALLPPTPRESLEDCGKDIRENDIPEQPYEQQITSNTQETQSDQVICVHNYCEVGEKPEMPVCVLPEKEEKEEKPLASCEQVDGLNTDHSLSTLKESNSESTFSNLKHIDSIILTSKKQTQEKNPYKQPKCIKLFKKRDYTPNATINYVKTIHGGSYPLKSCLKRSSSQSPSCLGRPGSGLKLVTPAKTTKFIK